ncbi:MAG: hypothetical protein D4R73_09600 [Deltaproteobacteria bacterium]|nr:MAG: hypothetical protein D4R73_09600 [Deltaproteobacteria bacterium]
MTAIETFAEVSNCYQPASSPQMSMQDNEIKSGIFPGKVISVDHGKLIAILTSTFLNKYHCDFGI